MTKTDHGELHGLHNQGIDSLTTLVRQLISRVDAIETKVKTSGGGITKTEIDGINKNFLNIDSDLKDCEKRFVALEERCKRLEETNDKD